MSKIDSNKNTIEFFKEFKRKVEREGTKEEQIVIEHIESAIEAMEALEKQASIRPVSKEIGICQCQHKIKNLEKYCKNCGRKIDWGEYSGCKQY